MELEKMKNVGPKTAQWLRDIGIETAEDLRAADVVDVYLRLRANRPGVTRVMLRGLQGAVMDIHWQAVPEDIMDDLYLRVEEA